MVMLKKRSRIIRSCLYCLYTGVDLAAILPVLPQASLPYTLISTQHAYAFTSLLPSPTHSLPSKCTPYPWADESDEEEEEEEPPPRQKRKHSTVARKPGTPRNSATVCDNMYLPPIIFIHCFNGQLPCVAVPHMCFISS